MNLLRRIRPEDGFYEPRTLKRIALSPWLGMGGVLGVRLGDEPPRSVLSDVAVATAVVIRHSQDAMFGPTTTENASQPHAVVRPMVRTVSVKGYGCVRDATLRLNRLHALIGPNDSGKSTLLRAIRTAFHFAGRIFPDTAGKPTPFNHGLTARWDPAGVPLDLRIDVDGASPESAVGYRFFDAGEKGRWSEQLLLGGVEKHSGKRTGLNVGGVTSGGPLEFTHLEEFVHLIGNCHFLHLDPTRAREPSKLIAHGQPLVLAEDGSGLPSIYDVILNRGDGSYQAIVASFQKLFPMVKRLGLKTIAPDTKTFEVELRDGTVSPAGMMSDGMLYFLAFSALEHLDPASMILIEEPENGLHPARIAEVIGLLRALSEKTQIVMATHSPMVVNALNGDEVSVITRSAEAGTRVTLLSDTPHYAERSRAFHNGELWVTYCNGVDEAPLLEDRRNGA